MPRKKKPTTPCIVCSQWARADLCDDCATHLDARIKRALRGAGDRRCYIAALELAQALRVKRPPQPGTKNISTRRRDAEIEWLAATGATTAELSRKYKISQRRVQQILDSSLSLDS